MREIETTDAPIFEFPFSQAIQTDDLIFLSGQVAIDPGTEEFVGPDVKRETEQIMENARGILEESGSSLDNLVKTTVFLTDINDFEVFNETYEPYLSKPYPARSAFEVANLVEPFTIEIEFVAEA